MSPGRTLETDKALAADFAVEVAEDRQTAEVKCKHENGEGPCPASWELEVEPDGTVTVGVRNALLAHARSHKGGFRKMRRLT